MTAIRGLTRMATLREVTEPTKLNLGCGSLRKPGFIGVDIGNGDGVDVQMDVLEFLRTLRTESVSAIYSRHFLEHLLPDQLRELLIEADRVLAPGGELEFIVPHFSNPYFYSDPTHRTPFGIYSFSYLCETSCLQRDVPSYAAISGWQLERVSLGFRPFKRPTLFGLKLPVLSDVLNRVVNKKTVFIELFERYCASSMSVYEIEFRVRKLPV